MNIVFFYHVRLSGGHNVDTGASIDPQRGFAVFVHQMRLMVDSGLVSGSDKFIICVNGSDDDFEGVTQFAYERRAEIGKPFVIWNGPNAESLLPTLSKLQEWLPGHEGWAVGLAHMKGVTHPGNDMVKKWADCLNHHTITNWRQNVADLESGQYDACGCHWTHNSPHDQNAHDWGANSYFGGGFFWATADYLMTLPKIPDSPKCRHDWFKGELWLGNGKPRIRDYHPGPVTNH